MFKVITREGVIHNCHTKERYDKFKASGWKDYTENDTKKQKAKASGKAKV